MQLFVPLVGTLNVRKILDKFNHWIILLQIDENDRHLTRIKHQLSRKLQSLDYIVLKSSGTKIIIFRDKNDSRNDIPDKVDIHLDGKSVSVPLKVERRDLSTIERLQAISSLMDRKLYKIFRKQGRKYFLKDGSNTKKIRLAGNVELIIKKGLSMEWFAFDENRIILGLKEVYDFSIEPPLNRLLSQFLHLEKSLLKDFDVNTTSEYEKRGFGPKHAGKIERIITNDDKDHEDRLKKILAYYKNKFATSPERYQQFLEIAGIGGDDKDRFRDPIIVTRKRHQGKHAENDYLSSILVLTPNTTTISSILDILEEQVQVDFDRKKIESEINDIIFPRTSEYHERMQEWLDILNGILSDGDVLEGELHFLTVRQRIEKDPDLLAKKVDLPTLCFGEGKISTVPKRGIEKHGPWGSLTPKKINVYIIGSKSVSKNIDKMKKELINAFSSFGIQKVHFHLHLYDSFIDRTRNVHRYIQELGSFIQQARTDKYPNKIILQIIPRSDSSPNSFYALIRQRSFASRGRDDDAPIPVQSIELGKLRNRHVYFNLALAMYSKLGGVPWKLKDPCSRLFDDAVYIGYDISRRPGRNDVFASIVVQDNHGEIIHYTNVPISTPQGKDIIPTEEFMRMIRHLVQDIKTDKKRIDVIVIHRDGDFSNEELEAMIKLENEDELSFIGLAVSKSSGLPLLMMSGQNVEEKVAESGFYFYVGTQLTLGGKLEKTYLLNTYGGDVPGGNVIPRLLKFRFSHVSKKLVNDDDESDWNRLIEDCVRQLFYLTRLNWAVKFGVSKLPVTIHLAHKASKILSLGISVDLKREQLWML